MHGLFVLAGGIFQITLLNLVLSGDNVGVIALATRNLQEEHARKASAIGISAAIILRIFFTSMAAVLIGLQWLPIKLVGGIVLLKITWDFIKPGKNDKDIRVKTSDNFWEAVLCIVIADITMSLDNVLAIGGAARGNIWLIIFGLLLNIPIIFFGSQLVVKLMNKYPIVVYIGGAVLAHTAVSMILDDRLVEGYIPHFSAILLPLFFGVMTLVYGIFAIRTSNNKMNNMNG